MRILILGIQKKILIVSNDDESCLSLSKILNTEVFYTVEVTTVEEAFDKIEETKSSLSLIFLEINVTEKESFKLLQKLNQTGLLKEIPGIITTKTANTDLEILCLKNGASDFIVRPYNTDLVLYRTKSIIRLWDNAGLISRFGNDILTGLYSLNNFYRRVIKILEKNHEKEYLFIYTDVDDFKIINTRYGIKVGDDLLKYIAKKFKDFVGSDGVVGRIGADNFAMLIPRERSIPSHDVNSKYEEFFSDSMVKGFALKCGVVLIKDRNLSVTEICDRAKVAVSSIKNQYGVHYVVYDDSMIKNLLRENELSDCMVDSLDKKEFKLYFQPKHASETGVLSGAEALVRWNHPKFGLISPGEFIPLFERNGFITKLDKYMLEVTCSTLKAWKEEGLPVVPVSVNISRIDFIGSGVANRIAKIVDSYGLPPELIHLEVTESAYNNNPQQIIETVSELRNLGFLIEMDDFGSGYSSLNMLSELPIDILKLDMRFMETQNDRIQNGKRNILSFIISLSKWLQLTTIAEGVETKKEFELLKSMGCNLIQGYYFSKPIPSEDFKKYIVEHTSSCELSKQIDATKELANPYDKELFKEKPTILVVEDIEHNRKILENLLNPYYQVVTANNGKEACDYLEENKNTVSCILLDLLMPVMDGFQVLENIKRNEIIKEIPVIITTEDSSDSELRAFNLGADGFVTKPYNAEILYHNVRKAVEESLCRKIKRRYIKNNYPISEIFKS